MESEKLKDHIFIATCQALAKSGQNNQSIINCETSGFPELWK